jgi:maltose O-acetyltransferase
MSPAGPASESAPARVLRTVGQDLRWGLRHLWVNAFGGWFLLPRVLRHLVYRSAGLDIHTPNVFDGARFRGPARVTIGPGTHLNRECYFEARAPITVGRDCRFGMQVMVVTSTHEFTPAGTADAHGSARPVTIGDRCWLGARVMVLPGVSIGDDVVVGAGSVVTRDCAPGGLYAGSPAVRVRDLTGT